MRKECLEVNKEIVTQENSVLEVFCAKIDRPFEKK